MRRAKEHERRRLPPWREGHGPKNTRKVQRPVGEGLGKTTTPPKNISCLLDLLGKTKRMEKTRGKEPCAEHEGGKQEEEQNGSGGDDDTQKDTATCAEIMVDGLVQG